MSVKFNGVNLLPVESVISLAIIFGKKFLYSQTNVVNAELIRRFCLWGNILLFFLNIYIYIYYGI